MELKINKVDNGYSVVVRFDVGAGQNYILNNTDEVLGRIVSLTGDFFRADSQQPNMPMPKV